MWLLPRKQYSEFTKKTSSELPKNNTPKCCQLQQNGTHFAFYLKFLNINFDIICLTEIGRTNLGIIDKEFPDHHIFIDPTTTAKGGVASLPSVRHSGGTASCFYIECRYAAARRGRTGDEIKLGSKFI